jgi:hypothetical protein
MKPLMLSKKNSSYLFDHVLDGFKSSHHGIEKLKTQGLINEDEYADLLRKNSDRLIERVQEFKLFSRLTCVFFAALFFYLQVTGDDIEARRARRTARGRRRHETEKPLIA